MKALRWTLFCLVAFAAGTGVALAMNPPSPGIPSSTASKLAADLSAVQQYASEGRCTAVRNRLSAAQSRVTRLPADTNPELARKIQRSLNQISEAASAECQGVADAALARQQEAAGATTPTTPEAAPTPTPEAQTTPPADDGTGDAGTTPDTGGGSATTPESGGPGQGGQGGRGPNGNGPNGNGPNGDGPKGGGPNGGAPVPEGASTLGDAIEQQVEQARKRWNQRMHELRKAWGQ